MHSLCLLLTLSAWAADTTPLEEYRSRRQVLRKSLDDGVAVLFGATEGDSGDLRSGFFQEPNFYYLTGWKEPGAVLILGPAGECLLLPRRSARRERYTGRKADPEDDNIRAVTGFDHVLPLAKLETELARQIESAHTVYTLLHHPAAEKLKALLPLRELSDAAPAIAKQRMTKSAAELALIQKSVDASMEAHRAAWKRMTPGAYEYQVAATFVASFMEKGCERSAYAPIVGSGPNSTVLHYAANSRRMDRGEVVVIDAAAECSMYAADITRTLPVGGKFSRHQRELHNIVLGAQKAVIEAVKPGVVLATLTKVGKDYFESHGQGKYWGHGVSHHVGLQVHDASSPAAPLEPGMVITVEPGLYIPEEGIGIRIEDMVLVTEKGAKVLSAALPSDPADIEKAMSRR